MKDTVLNQLAKTIHSNNVQVGWWKENQCLLEKCQLVSTEVAEATEGARKGLMDDHLPEFSMEGVELADALIRTLDLGGRLELHYTELPLEHPLVGKDCSVGSNHLAVNYEIVSFSKAILLGKSNDVLSHFYSTLIGTILQVARVRGHNIAKMTFDKLEYNKNRADHKLENRAKEGGKSF